MAASFTLIVCHFDAGMRWEGRPPTSKDITFCRWSFVALLGWKAASASVLGETDPDRSVAGMGRKPVQCKISKVHRKSFSGSASPSSVRVGWCCVSRFVCILVISVPSSIQLHEKFKAHCQRFPIGIPARSSHRRPPWR